MIVATVFGKIISIFIIMIVGVICCKMGIIDDYTKQRLSRLSTLVVNPILIMIGHFLLHEREGYDLSIEKFAVTYDNCGFIGVPLGYALFGNIGVIYATVFVAVFHIFCWTHGIMLLDKGGFQLKKLINPCLIAVIAGMAFFIFQIRLPESIDFAMSAIGDMNTPLAMLLSGAIMTQLNFKEVLTKTLFRGDTAPDCFVRTVLFVTEISAD